jgi:polyisoprenoid-binding protein YceI
MAGSFLIRTTLVATVFTVLPLASAMAQKTFTIDSRSSLAWWQVNPHMKHLWGTTCPGDPSWRAGEGVSVSQAQSLLSKAYKRTGYAAVRDTIVPLYPRRKVRSVCEEGGVTGQVSAADVTTWRGLRGQISIRGDHLTSGLKIRDAYTDDLLDVQKFPEIKFRIDSVSAVQPGDTTRATVVGVFMLHGVETPMSVPVRAWKEAGGLRVLGKFDIAALDLIEVYNLSKWKLGLGVQTNIWQTLHLGFDVLLRESPSSGSQ